MSNIHKISGSRVGVYVDVANLSLNGGYHLQYGVLREFAFRDGATPTRLNAYVAYDADRAPGATRRIVSVLLAFTRCCATLATRLWSRKSARHTCRGTRTKTGVMPRPMPTSTWR